MKKIKHLLIFLGILSSNLFAQDDFVPPASFEYNQSRLQSFYLFIGADVDGVTLQEGDWIGAFSNDVCVGSWPWEGEYTAVPAMGDDGSQWTTGYLQEDQIPTFKIYDASANMYFIATPSENHGFEDLGTWVVSDLSVLDDCSGTLGGLAFIDDCGECAGGNSGNIENSSQDCEGNCFGDAYIDGCGECVGGSTGLDACPLDCTGQLTPDDCSDSLLPGCAYFDDCGVCVGGTSGNSFNQDADCLGVCFGSAEYDECGVCAGDDSLCNQPVALYQTVSVEEDGSVQIVLEATDPNEDDLTFELVSFPENGNFILSDLPILTYAPNADFNGFDSFGFTVTDGTWTSGVGIVTINVNAVNDAPVLMSLENQSVNEDTDFSMTLFAEDVDGDDLFFSASNSDFASISVNNNILEISPNLNFNGDIEVEISVSDGELINSEIFILTVLPINDPMDFASIIDQSTQEDTPLVIDLDVEDVDGPFLVFTSENSGNVTLEFIGSTLTITPDQDWSGEVFISITAFDGEFSRVQDFNLTVTAVNDSPILDFISDHFSTAS